MPTSTSPAFDAVTIAVYVLVLLIPGLATGLAVGLRGWVLAAMAPLFTYAIGGLAGPWYAAIGVPFNVGTFLVATVLFTGVAFGLRWLTVRRYRAKHDGARPVVEALWARHGHLAVLACLLLATAVGLYTVFHGLGKLNSIAQGFDAVYHANGIRYITDTGDGSLFGTGQTNWYGDAAGVFYPNAYHLIGAIAYQLTDASIPSILNSNTVLLPGLLALSLVAVVREFRGRAVLAGAAALVAVAPATALYESMDRGPLLPFLLGLAFTPLGAVALHRYLTRPAADTGFVFVVAAVGLLTVHSSTLFAGILFALPMLIQRWLNAATPKRRTIGRDLLALLPMAVASVLVAWLQLFGALGLASGNVPYWGWPPEGKASTALGSLLLFQHFEANPQVWLAAALFLGLVFFARLNGLRWIGGTALVVGIFYIAVSSATDSELVKALSRPWWDDPFRFISMAAVPLCLIAAHGLAETQSWLRDRIEALPKLPPRVKGAPWLAAGLAAVVLVGFAGVSKGLYTRSNTALVAPGYTRPDKHDMPVSADEAQAMLELGKRAKPGEWAMNDRFDGTVWTYAISGVRTVAGHFDEAVPPSDALLLGDHFREYDTNPKVRDAVRRLNVRWVIVGRGGYPAHHPRQEGLIGLDTLPFLELVYRNADASVYRLKPEPGQP
ncbi:DUF6541 family protein [Amycolatopsis anabasis]|uniref:DUF6541 family protein n=1 Tax=Amycolatopsis anabasis TaxID=1840409 RepID=UPI00131D3038|nr:DUF6541 family protein [Amycolatopsis anabasis]